MYLQVFCAALTLVVCTIYYFRRFHRAHIRLSPSPQSVENLKSHWRHWKVSFVNMSSWVRKHLIKGLTACILNFDCDDFYAVVDFCNALLNILWWNVHNKCGFVIFIIISLFVDRYQVIISTISNIGPSILTFGGVLFVSS